MLDICPLFHQQPRRAVATFTSCCSELPSVYTEDNRHQVPTNSCCSTLLPLLQEFEGGGNKRGEVQKGEEDCTISAGKRRALVHSLLAVESGVAAGTLAHVAAAIVLLPALAAVEAGGVGASQQAVLAVGALETLDARAHVAIFQILGGKRK